MTTGHNVTCSCTECANARITQVMHGSPQLEIAGVSVTDQHRRHAEALMSGAGAPIFQTAEEWEVARDKLADAIAHSALPGPVIDLAGQLTLNPTERAIVDGRIGQLRDDEGRWATQGQAIEQLNRTAKELRDALHELAGATVSRNEEVDRRLASLEGLVASLEVDRRLASLESRLEALGTRETETIDRMFAAHRAELAAELVASMEQVRTDLAASMEQVRTDLSQLTGELEGLKAARARR